MSKLIGSSRRYGAKLAPPISASKLNQDEISLGKRSYAVVVLREILVVAGHHCRACTANGPSRDDAVDDSRWESSLRTGPVGVESLYDVGVRPLTLAARMVPPE